MTKLLDLINESGLASFLAVLKVFGEMESPGLMSFPRPGLTLALDFRVGRQGALPLVDRLCAITSDFGGRLYPAKDARMTSGQFCRGYPALEEFSRYIDPLFSSSFWRRVAG
jgi:hypothetical protein